jgi:DinB family protein
VPDQPEWSVGEDEKRTAGVIAYHIASVIAAPHTYLLGEAVAGKPLDLVRGWTVDNVAEWNAGVAEEQVNVTQAEVLELLRTNTDAAVELLRSLSDEQLQRPLAAEDQEALVAWCGGARTVEELAQNMLIGHIHHHRSSLRATVGR